MPTAPSSPEAVGRLLALIERGIVPDDPRAVGVPKLALTLEQAAWACEMSVDTLQRTSDDELPKVRRGRLVRIRVDDLRRYLDSLVSR
jgi:hypothetical protein